MRFEASTAFDAGEIGRAAAKAESVRKEVLAPMECWAWSNKATSANVPSPPGMRARVRGQKMDSRVRGNDTMDSCVRGNDTMDPCVRGNDKIVVPPG